VESAARTGARFSADLIYARSGQTIGAWRAELGEALRLPAEHFSLYQLTIEPRTALARAVQHGRIAACPIEGAARFYEVTQEICDAAGAPAYEISNHARTDAARARHNLLYWEAQDWIGVGPGAHGRVTIGAVRRATKAFDAPADYIAAIARSGVGWESAEALSAIERAEEAVLMGLRLKEGLDRRSGEVGALLRTDRLAALAADGLVLASPERVALTPAGRLVADRIALELCA
jgi:oxygen-independent coproporphyrinogen-3 oxidase